MLRPKQFSILDIYDGCLDAFENDKPEFLRLLEDNINMDELIPWTIKDNYYLRTGRPRKYPLTGFVWALFVQQLLGIPTTTLLITILKFSNELRELCGFDKVPDPSKFTRFKQEHLHDLDNIFNHCVDITEPICQEIDDTLSSVLIFDTSGVEPHVTENNPKYLNSKIRGLKAYKKSMNFDDSYSPHEVAYAMMPSHAASSDEVKQMYVNGHITYAFKFGVLTNGLGIIRDISFFDSGYLKSHPDITVEKKSKSPDEDKTLSDAKALIPVLKDFFVLHPAFSPDTFIGDAAFDASNIYNDLLSRDMSFTRALIPLNKRRESILPDCPINDDGTPCCPNDSSLLMKHEGSKSHLRCGKESLKFVCPKMKWVVIDGKNKRRTACENPCTDSPCGRMFYVYPEKDLRLYPGIIRGTDEWDTLYKKRGVIERTINHFKECYSLSYCRTRNADTIHADLIVSGITQLLTVIIAHKIHKHEHIRSLKPLIAA